MIQFDHITATLTRTKQSAEYIQKKTFRLQRKNCISVSGKVVSTEYRGMHKICDEQYGNSHHCIALLNTAKVPI